MDDDGWEKAKKQKLDDAAVVVADDNDANTMDLGGSSSAAKMMDLGVPSWVAKVMDLGDSSEEEEGMLNPWAWPPNEVCPYAGSGGWIDFPGRKDEEEDREENDDEIMPTSPFRSYWDCRTPSSDDDDEDDDWRKKMNGTEILEPLKKAQRASLDMYDRLEKEFKASSQECKHTDWKKRVDRVRTILKEVPEFRMWEHRKYEDLMLVVIYYHTYKSPYQSLRANRFPENGELVPSTLYRTAHSYDKGRDEQRVAFQKELEKSDLAKENPDPSSVLSKAQDIAKPFNLLRLKDVKRAVDFMTGLPEMRWIGYSTFRIIKLPAAKVKFLQDYLHVESCKRTLGDIRDLLRQHVLKKNSCKGDVSDKILEISEYALPFSLFHDSYSLICRLDSLEDDEALREIDNEYERNLTAVVENKVLFSRADYLSLKLRFSKEFGF